SSAENLSQYREEIILLVDRCLSIGLDRSGLRHAPGRGMIRRHIETITDIARGARIHCLPFFGEEPVNINLRSVRVRRAIEDRQTAGRGTDVRAFFQLPNIDDLDRHSLLCALFSQTIGEPESDRIAPLAEHVDLLSIIPEQGKALTGDRSNKFHSELRMEKKESESRLAWTGLARVICD